MDFSAWIKTKCDQINQYEAKGAELLANGESEGYRNIMREKAELLAKLSEEAGPYLTQVSTSQADFAVSTLRGFSASAKQALKLDSVFYMSALLFPDEHKPGEPHNLELFIEEWEEFC